MWNTGITPSGCKEAKENCTTAFRSPIYAAQAAKRNPWKLLTNGFREHFENYEVFCAMYTKTSIYKNKLVPERKICKTNSTYAERTDLISYIINKQQNLVIKFLYKS
jgi:hypothetical protein